MPLGRLCEGENICGTVGYVPVHTTVRLQTVDDEEKKLVCFLISTQKLQVVRLTYFTSFLELRDAGGLYIDVRDLPDATRGKLVVIEASRVLFGSTFVYRVLRVIPQSEMCSHEISDST